MTYFKHCVASPWSATQSCMAIGKRQQTESLKSELCQQDPTWRHGSEAKWVPYFHCFFLLLKHCSWDAPLALHPALKNWSKRKTHQVNTKGLHSCDLIWCSLSACKKGKKKENLKQKVLGEWWISKCRVAVNSKIWDSMRTGHWKVRTCLGCTTQSTWIWWILSHLITQFYQTNRKINPLKNDFIFLKSIDIVSAPVGQKGESRTLVRCWTCFCYFKCSEKAPKHLGNLKACELFCLCIRLSKYKYIIYYI